MTTFNRQKFHTLAAITLCALHSVSADVIELTHGDKLTGTINALNKKGVTLTSKLTPTPLEINTSNIQNITFDTQKAPSQKHAELLTLSNGDTLPCEVISLDDNTLQISTWYAGKFSIPRSNIHSLQFGVSQDKIIYQGTDTPSEWSTHEGRWKFSELGYSCQGAGTLARELQLPENLRIQFGLSWKQTPNIAVRFCAENNKATTKQDCYELLFNSGGLQIRRYLKGQRRSTPLASIDLKPHKIDNQKLHIDLRIDRAFGKITLYLDGKKRGSWVDTFDTAKGNFILLNNRSSQGDGCHIANLSVSNWRGGSQPQHQKKLPQGKADLLIDNENERHSGHVLSISKATSKNRLIQFEKKHNPKPLNVPARRIDTLIFAQQDDTEKSPKAHYSAQLIGGGHIQLNAPQLANDKITTDHPILGPCTIKTNVVSQIEAHAPPTPKSK